MNLPEGKFAAILADPPWHFKTYNEKGRKRSPDWKPFKGSPSVHYDTMSADQIVAMPVADRAADDAVLFLWACWPMLPEALTLIEAWGFTFKTCAFCWAKADNTQPDMWAPDLKPEIGMGYWTRANTEPCLLATRGKPKRIHADVRQAIIAPRREHSRKPDGIHGRIERLVGGPYLELFGRAEHPNWTTWGNETTKFQPAVAAQ